MLGKLTPDIRSPKCFILFNEVITTMFSSSIASHLTRRCLEICQAIGYPTCLIMEMATAPCPEIAWPSGTAFAACRRLCTTKPWARRWLRSAAPWETTPCGSYTSGSKDRPSAGSRGSIATWPVPKPWSTYRSTRHRATPSLLRRPTGPCPYTVATRRWGLTTWPMLIPNFPPPSSDESRALTDGSGHKSTRFQMLLSSVSMQTVWLSVFVFLKCLPLFLFTGSELDLTSSLFYLINMLQKK